MKNGKKLYNERGITFFHETERYVNDLNIYNRSKNGTNLWDNLIIRMWESSYKITSHGMRWKNMARIWPMSGQFLRELCNSCPLFRSFGDAFSFVDFVDVLLKEPNVTYHKDL